MRIHLISDIHLEFGKFRHSPPECDVAILSGDIGVGFPGVMWAAETFDCPVVYVCGNHEFYGKKRSFPGHYDKLKAKAEGTNVHVLQNDSVVIDGVRFMGGTLWADFNLYGNSPLGMVTAQQKMNDYQSIFTSTHGNPARLTAQRTASEHAVTRMFLQEELEKEFDGKTVVVTHHAPSELSVHENYRNDKLTPAYASRLENFILAYNPTLWTHGHLHDSADYMIGDTRIVCNPRGYVGHYLNPKFDPNLVIEI